MYFLSAQTVKVAKHLHDIEKLCFNWYVFACMLPAMCKIHLGVEGVLRELSRYPPMSWNWPTMRCWDWLRRPTISIMGHPLPLQRKETAVVSHTTPKRKTTDTRERTNWFVMGTLQTRGPLLPPSTLKSIKNLLTRLSVASEQHRMGELVLSFKKQHDFMNF